MFSPDSTRPPALIPIGIEAVRFGLSYMRKPGGVMVWRSVCALGVVLGGCSWREDARVVGDGVAVVSRPDAVRVWLLMVWKLLRSGRGCGGQVWRVCS